MSEKRGPDHGMPAFFGDVDQPAPHDLEPDGVGLDPGRRLFEPLVGPDHDPGRGGLGEGEAQVQGLVHGEGAGVRHDGRRLALLDDGRPFDDLSGGERIAVVDRDLRERGALRRPSPAPALERGGAPAVGAIGSVAVAAAAADVGVGGAAGALGGAVVAAAPAAPARVREPGRWLRRRPGAHHPPVQDLDLGPVVEVGVAALVLLGERLDHGRQVVRRQGLGRQRHRDLVHLAV